MSTEKNLTNEKPAPEASKKFELLKALLRKIFQLDRGDLDFGLYRIMNLKSKEINEFLERELLPQVKEVLTGITNEERASLEKSIGSALRMAEKLKVDPDTSGMISELNEQLADAIVDAEAEGDVYNHLINFFSRYYIEGDFISQRRYSNDDRPTYLIPYDGEEVKMYWANSDQYYIKTTENYAAYAFTVGEGASQSMVRFEICDADSEKDNVKEKSDNQRRYFLASGNQSIEFNGSELTIRFEHRPLTPDEKSGRLYPGNGGTQQTRINETTVQEIIQSLDSKWLSFLTELAPTHANPERTILQKHVERYTAKNSFDYFIHKNLNGFLRGELDRYLKSEVLNLDELSLNDTNRLRRAIKRTHAIRHVGYKLIAFLAQLEEFQKKLWLKKKFVLDSQWCVTLDRIPESLYTEITSNEDQIKEWVQLYAIDEISGDLGNGGKGFSVPLSVEFLKLNPYLIVDTQYFDSNFADRLLSALSDAGSLDEQLDGVLVQGENYQALKLLQKRYQGQMKCIHIDPPYNTQTSGFLYKNNYRHSSWLSMMHDRISTGIALLNENGSFLCHIDENEYERLYMLFEIVGIPDASTVIWDKRNPMTGGGGIAVQHEYVIWRSKSDRVFNLRNGNFRSILEKAEELTKKYSGTTDQAKKEFSNWVNLQDSLTGGEKAYNKLDDYGRVYGDVSLRAPEPRTDQKFFEPLIHPLTGKPCPVPPNGFSRTPQTLRAMVKRGEILFGKDETIQPRQKRYLTEDAKKQLTSIVQNARKGKADLKRFGLEDFPYSHSKSFYMELLGAVADEPNDIVLDYFAGSGTTGHATIQLNREDGRRRNYVLVEMSDYFDTILLPRIKKSVYSESWRDGSPISRDGISQFLKVIRLESYEDTLDGLEHTPSKSDLISQNPVLAEDYHLRYSLGSETSSSPNLAVKEFINPDSYYISTVRDGTSKDIAADLPETFNYLIGLQIEQRHRIDGVLAIAGKDSRGRECLVLWRDVNKTDNPTLQKWVEAHSRFFGAQLEIVYVNGDHTLNSLGENSESWSARTIEPEFRKLMFENADEV